MGIARMIKTIQRNKNAASVGTAVAESAGGRVALDYPQPGEKITAGRYTFRAGAVGEIERVEISVNQGPWLPCRYSVGYWWHDWSGYATGRYQAEIKACLKNGRVVAAVPVKFQVFLTGGK